MCGLAGFSLANGETFNSRRLADELLLEIVARGRHATGVAVAPCTIASHTHPRASIRVNKRAVPAPTFIRQNGTKSIGKCTRTVLLHTRWATKGTPANPDNNHPIITGDVVGTHNGSIRNDDAIFEWVGGVEDRIAQVDSEAIFHMIDRRPEEPYNLIGSLRGRAALAWIERGTTNTLRLARVTDSPLAIGQTEAGSLIYASTMSHLLKACDKAAVDLTWYDTMAEHTYMTVTRGVIREYREFGDGVKTAV